MAKKKEYNIDKQDSKDLSSASNKFIAGTENKSEELSLNSNRMISSILQDETDPWVKEAYKTLRANLKLALNKEGCKRIIITSSLPNEGKTTNCCNLAITLAQMESRVLIVDSDLRKPSIHTHFSLPQTPGLSEVLSEKNLSSEVVQATKFPNLKIVTAGAIPQNPVELLGCPTMKRFISEMSELYDYILIDTPPVNLVADVITITNLADGIVIVVREGSTKHPEFQRALSNLDFAGVKILGAILNNANINMIYGSQNKYKKYQSYYR